MDPANPKTLVARDRRISRPDVSPSEPTTYLEAKNLAKRYKSRTVVKDVSLKVKNGEVVGLLGPNGAGKTTCFYMMVGLVPEDGGSIFLDGKDITRLPIHRRAQLGLSYLPQEASIFRKLTVAENIRAVLELQNLGKEALDAAAGNSAGRTTHLPIFAITQRSVYPAANGAGLKSRGHWPAIRVLFYWMNRLPGLTRSPC